MWWKLSIATTAVDPTVLEDVEAMSPAPRNEAHTHAGLSLNKTQAQRLPGFFRVVETAEGLFYKGDIQAQLFWIVLLSNLGENLRRPQILGMGRAFKIVILGGGVAAGYAASEFVKHGVNYGELCIISEEAVAPYERPALSKGCLLPEDAATLPAFHTCVGVGAERQTPKWYKEHGIELVLGTRIKAVDVKLKTLLSAAGETITYKTLIIATGARVLRLEEFGVSGADAKNICYLRDWNDCKKLVEVMGLCRGGMAVVIGGGYIGMECAAALVSNKMKVTMVFPEQHCMARLFTPEIASFYEDNYKKRGVEFIKGSVMTAFESDAEKKVTAVVLKDKKQIKADMVVVGIGIRPNVSLFESQLALEKGGIKVNGKMQTSNSSVYAVGDVVSFSVKLYGDVRRLEHVDHARKSAAQAVEAIMSPEKVQDYDYLPFFYSRAFTSSWQFYGENVGKFVLFGNLKGQKFGAFWVDRGHIVGAFLEGGNKDEYASLATLARLQPYVKDIEMLAKQGLSFPFFLKGSVGESTALISSMTAEKNQQVLLGPPSSYLIQVCAGIAVAVGVSAFAFWYGKKRRRW
ncbi:hypothetical protein L7F22_001083 [Adiantum nelumboides]|nr:hypothetical protein [Adiantum nelumboides]